ncbi:hypothetical protein HDU86_006354 [Geranomyces michiganensis]|nr:hypothetical protein HDU86_006354 [Geranomyces michiganensis]
MSTDTMYTHRSAPEFPITAVPNTQVSARNSGARQRAANPPWRCGAISGGGGGGGGASAMNAAARERELSAPTRGILKSMMHASKLSASQQRFLDEFLTSGAPLPARPTAGMSFRPEPIPRESSTLLKAHQQPARQRMPPNRRPQIRPLAAIASSDAFEIEAYRPDYSVEKGRLQDRMEGVTNTDDGAQGSSLSAAGRGRRRRGHELVNDSNSKEEAAEIDEFNMLMEEIADRRQWLDDMVAMGHGDPHKRQIQLEISQRIRRLEALDSERTRASELARAAK